MTKVVIVVCSSSCRNIIKSDGYRSRCNSSRSRRSTSSSNNSNSTVVKKVDMKES